MLTMVLCGGRGNRLRPLTNLLPKPLIPINGKPCLQYIIEQYMKKGVDRFVLGVGYRAGMIVDFVRAQRFNAHIEFSDAGEHASMLERLCLARPLMGDRAFVAYGDTLVDVNLDDMLQQHLAANAMATITTAPVRSPFGIVRQDDRNRVRWFEEKPVQWYYVGHMLLENSALDGVTPAMRDMPDGEGLVMLLQQLAAEGTLRSHPYCGAQMTFNTYDDLHGAELGVRNFCTFNEAQSHA